MRPTDDPVGGHDAGERLARGVSVRIGMTAAQLTVTATAGTALELQPAVDGERGPTQFVLATPAGPVRGSLEPDTTPAARVTGIHAGARCGD